MLAVWVFALSTACVGTVDEPPSQRSVTGPTPVAPGQLAAARVRRLTSTEYARTLDRVFGETGSIEFPTEAFANGYDNRADQLVVNGVLADRLYRGAPDIAARIASAAIASAGCAPDEACARTLLSDAATRAYRRPVSDVELEELLTVFRVGIDGTDFASGVALALEVVLQSAEMLYHAELGDDSGGAIRLTQFEVAEQIAYTLTGGPPDDLLAADAANGSILEPDVRAEHARRILGDRASTELLGDFAVRWLEVATLLDVGRSAELYPEWPSIRGSALAETRESFARAVQGDLDIASLLTSTTSSGDDVLATFYGATRDADGTLHLPAGERFGVLTQASILAKHSLTVDSAPVHRGKLVRVRLLCETLPGPPPDLVIMTPAEDPTLTSRERWEATTAANATCWTCHERTDMVGYGFENYDAIGRWRSMDNGKPVNAASTLAGTDVDGDFAGPADLVNMLAGSARVRECFARNWLEFSTGRTVEEETVATVSADFISSGGSLRDLMIAIVRSDAFVTRSAMGR